MAKQQDIDRWAGLIKQCNAYLAATYPENFIDLQAWFTSQGKYAGGGFKTRDFFPDATAQAVANDQADQARGIVPRSLRPPEAITHLNAAGYTAIGKLVYEFMRDKKLLPQAIGH
jgi:hypothetical protein